MRTTFINQNSDNTILEKGEKYLESTLEDLRFYMENGTEMDEDFDPDNLHLFNQDKLDIYQGFQDRGSFYDYGLSFDFVEAGTFEDQPEGYYRYQFSYGGPSDEMRFHPDGTIEYVFMDWFCGVGFDVTGEEAAEWLKDYMIGCAMIDWENLEYWKIYSEEEE